MKGHLWGFRCRVGIGRIKGGTAMELGSARRVCSGPNPAIPSPRPGGVPRRSPRWGAFQKETQMIVVIVVIWVICGIVAVMIGQPKGFSTGESLASD
jgi:hypothetical protein